MADHIPEYLRSHVLAGDRLSVSLTDRARELASQLTPGGRAAVTLVKEAGITVVLLALAKSNELTDHHAPGAATVQVLEGQIEIAGGARPITGEAGALVTFAPGVEHSIKALTDSTVLVTVVAPPAG
ncbi:MAG: cupin domain-containing protein [Dehalococcoidia bacterium]